MKTFSTASVLIGLSLSTLTAANTPSDTSSQSRPHSLLDTRLFKTDVVPRKINQDLINTDDFEIGAFAGLISVEDFGSNFIWGATLTYHLSEDLFTQLNYATASTQKTSFETLSGGANLLQESERDLSYYNVSLGYNILQGQAFIGKSYTFNTNFFLVAGLGNTQFAGDSHLTSNFGWGYQFLATDWLSLQLNMRDHIFKLDILGESKTTHNLEFTSGISIFF